MKEGMKRAPEFAVVATGAKVTSDRKLKTKN
jgi:hypothetical protein